MTRLAAMTFARLFPARASRTTPAGLDLLHYPVTVPIPEPQGLPTVVSLFDIQHHDMPELFSRAERGFRGWAYDDCARKAGEVITITHFSAARIAERLEIPAERIHAIHLGIDHKRYRPQGPRATIAGLPERYLFYPANAWPHKNHDALLEAFSRIDDEDLHLVLTGSGHEPRADDKARRIHRLGHVPADQLPGLYRGAVALVFPSLYEGFGFPPLEAMACGCPVTASDVAAVAEVCADAALPFDPREPEAITDAMNRISADEQLRSRLRENGLGRAKGFTWEKTAEQHLAVYETALSAAG